MLVRVSCLVFGLALLGGCAHMTVYDSSLPDKGYAGAKKLGIPVYKPVPHLLVRYNAEKDKPFSSELLMLPDVSDPYYVVQHAGIGTNNTALTLQNGILTNLNSVSDSKVPETLTAAGGLLTSAATAASTLAPLFAAAQATTSSQGEDAANTDSRAEDAAAAITTMARRHGFLAGAQAADSIDPEKLKAAIKKVLDEMQLEAARKSLETPKKQAKAVSESLSTLLTSLPKEFETLRAPLELSQKAVAEVSQELEKDELVQALVSGDKLRMNTAKAVVAGKIDKALLPLTTITLQDAVENAGNLQSAIAANIKALRQIREVFTSPAEPFFKLFRIDLGMKNMTVLQQVYPDTTN